MTTLSRERVQRQRNAWQAAADDCIAHATDPTPMQELVALCDSWLATDVGEVKRYYPVIEGIDDVRACMVWDEKGIVTCTFVKSEAYDALAAAHRAAVSERDAALKDAERYRWLRKGAPPVIHADRASYRDGRGPYVAIDNPGVQVFTFQICDQALDTAIDAALSSGKSE